MSDVYPKVSIPKFPIRQLMFDRIVTVSDNVRRQTAAQSGSQRHYWISKEDSWSESIRVHWRSRTRYDRDGHEKKQHHHWNV